MIRGVMPAAILLLALRGSAFGAPAVRITGMKCFDDGTLVGETDELRLVTFKEGHWQPLPLAKFILRLWRSPDDRIFAISSDDKWSAVEVPHGVRSGSRWNVEASSGRLTFTSLAGDDVVTPHRIYRMDPEGKLTEVAEVPTPGNGERLPPRAPEILVARGTRVVCLGTSVREFDDRAGSCWEWTGAYAYRVDFGDPLCCPSDVPTFSAPFVCGDAVISAVRDPRHHPVRETTQARDLVTGARLGRAEGAARGGSTCLDGQRALLVGKRDLQIVSLPGLRPLWRVRFRSEIQAVAVCGKTKAVVVRKGSAEPFEEIDLTAQVTSDPKNTPVPPRRR